MRPRFWRYATVAVAVLGGLAVFSVSTSVFPHYSLNHDEAVYLQQAAMLLDGQLVLRPPVEDVFRPWFFVDDGGRLYAKYAPVPAAMFALGRLLGGYRLALVAIAAGNLVLVSAVVREVFDRRTGLLAAAFVLASPLFLLDSAVFLPYAPTTLLNLSFAYAYLRADRLGDRRLAALAGAAIGLAFFARPYTAVLFAAPFVVHACWRLWGDWRARLPRLASTAILGLAGVGLALAYNAVLTGSPWLFPYEAFAPLDGLGFGRRALLGHGVDYTPALALRANREVLWVFFSEWFVGGLAGMTLAALGVVAVTRRGWSARPAALAGLFLSIAVGNGYFWGNRNILGDLSVAGDGLIGALGPYYHFDLLLPAAAFAAVGGITVATTVREIAHDHLAPRPARAVLLTTLLLGTVVLGGVTAAHADTHVEDNMEVTRTYERAYVPFEGGPPANALVLLPTPYGEWLNHPFQPLRNEPDFDGRAVYAIDDRPFAVADAFPDRRLYRYTYRGPWAPYDGSPMTARLQPVDDVAGRAVHVETTVGVPDGAVGVTARVATDEGGDYYVAPTLDEELDIRLVVTEGAVRLHGDVTPVGDGTLGVTGRDAVRLTIFVDFGAGDGLTYRLDLPVDASAGVTRALSPRVEWCRDARTCGGEAAYVPETAPAGVSIRTTMAAADQSG